MPTARLQRETVVLVLLLVCWAGALDLFLNTPWRPWFTQQELPVTPPPQQDGARVPGESLGLDPPAEGGRLELALGSLGFERGEDYLLTLRAQAGPAFTLEIKTDSSQPPLRKLEIRRRSETTPYIFFLPSAELAETVHVRYLGPPRAPMPITALSVYRLSAGHRLVIPLVSGLGPLLLCIFILRNRRELPTYLRSPPLREGSTTWRGMDRLVAAVLFVLLLVAYRQSPVNHLFDYKHITVVSHQLVEHGTLAMPPQFKFAEGKRFVTHGGKNWHYFPHAPAILNAPFVYAFEALGKGPLSPQGRFLPLRERKILRFCAAFCSAWLCAVLFFLGRVWLRPWDVLPLVIVFAFGTQIYSTLSRPYWSHTWATLLLAIALLLLLHQRFEHLLWPHIGAATALSWSFFCRPNLSLSILGLTAFVALERRRFLPWWIGVGALWLILFIAHSLLLYDSSIPSYFYSSHVEAGRIGSAAAAASYPEGMLATLLSPGRGLFIYVPFFGFILFATVYRWRFLPSRTLAIIALVVIFAHWQLISSFRDWRGGLSFGPRFFSDIVPWFFLLAVFAVAAHRRTMRGGAPPLRLRTRAVLLLLIAGALFVNIRGATAKATIHWEKRKLDAGFVFPPPSPTFRHPKMWNWSYPQFLAGLHASDEASDEP